MKKYFAIVAVFLSACAIQPRQIPARIYQPTGEIIQANFNWVGGLTGSVNVNKSQEICKGEYSTLRSGTTSTSVGVVSWGSIFSLGTSTSSVSENAQRGSAVAVCPSGEMIECEYTISFNPGYRGGEDPDLLVGSGSCKSNKTDIIYKLMIAGGGRPHIIK